MVKIGEKYSWTINGKVKQKMQGQVVATVPANTCVLDYISTKKNLSKYNLSSIRRNTARESKSYLVAVGDKLYFPQMD